ncbi:MAG TPA: enhanced serine sensitivity protein SseB C-terminal domain-containing protein [Candidatus Binatia bacterium]|nr:enhanced serine sensitivity protein SseB C-terminal domain-containing protein [Candidatus Binatia bacterium]
MSLRRRDSSCFVRREDEKSPGPPGGDAQQAKMPSPAAGAPPGFANSALPAAMLAVAKDDSPQNRQVLYQSMLDTWFVVPTRETVPDKPGFAAVPTNIAGSFSLEHDSAGQLVAVAFTDEEALRNWNQSIPWIALQGPAFFQAVVNTGAEEIVINPYEPANPGSKMIRPGGRVTRWEFEDLAQGRIPQGDSSEQEAEPQSVLVTMPRKMPSSEMFDAIGKVAGTFPEISGMYFGQVIYPDGGPHWTVAVEFVPDTSVKQVKHMMAALVEEARRVFPRSVTTDLLPASTALGQSIKKSGRKFY